MRRPSIFVRSEFYGDGENSKNRFLLTHLAILAIFSALFGPKLGMRAMVQCRFSWGYVQNIMIPSLFLDPGIYLKITDIYIYRYYAAALPSILNVFSAQSYLILNTIIGGQALAAVSDKLNDTLGIVVIALISFSVGFSGWYKYLLAEILLVQFSCLFLSRLPFADTNFYTGIYLFPLASSANFFSTGSRNWSGYQILLPFLSCSA